MICKNELRCTMKDVHCGECRENPKAELKSYFHDRGYIPTCLYGYDDCIHDPAYVLNEYDNGHCSWVRERYTRNTLLKAVEEGCNCDNGCDYDDEDK